MSGQYRNLIAVLAATCLSCLPASAQPDTDSTRQLSVRAGLFEPSDATFRDVYRGSRMPIVVQVDWGLRPRLALFGGLRYLRLDGSAVVEGGGAPLTGPSERATGLTLTSGRAGALLQLPYRRWDVRLGGGLVIQHYSEEWSAAGLRADGNRAGVLLQGTVARLVGRRFSAGVSVEYSRVSLPAGLGQSAAAAVNLGGVDVLAGVALRF